MAILGASMAQRYIDKMGKYLEYNINVMNENGIIIASRDGSRIGDFHEVAYEMLHGTPDANVVADEKKYIGTKPGVNLFIEYKNKPVGVIGVTGDPESVKAFAGLVKISLEAMMEHEIYLEKKRTRKNKTEQFLYSLLFEENPDEAMLENLAAEIEIEKERLLAVLIIHVNKPCDRAMLIRSLKNAKGWNGCDLVTVATNDNLVVLKSLDTKDLGENQDFKFTITEFIASFLEQISSSVGEEDLGFYVGSLQKRWIMYRKSYIHAHELFMRSKIKSGIVFFDDSIVDYFRSMVTLSVWY